MSRFIEDKDGDHLQVIAEQEGDLHGVTLAATQRDNFDEETTTHHATVGPVDPRALIEAIKAECELHEDDEVHDSPVVEETARQINTGHFVVHENGKTIPLGRDEHGRFIPATAEAPRLWAGADEPVIDGLIGRVWDLEQKVEERTEEERQLRAHSVLADHWDRRLAVVRTALSMLPAPGKRGGLAAAFAGEEVADPLRVENALKIARFAADEDRNIPGVDS